VSTGEKQAAVQHDTWGSTGCQRTRTAGHQLALITFALVVFLKMSYNWRSVNMKIFALLYVICLSNVMSAFVVDIKLRVVWPCIFLMKWLEMPTGRTEPSSPHTRPTQRLSRPPPIQKLGSENHMLQLNIQCCWWWEYVPETCRARYALIKLPSCIKLVFQVIS